MFRTTTKTNHTYSTSPRLQLLLFMFQKSSKTLKNPLRLSCLEAVLTFLARRRRCGGREPARNARKARCLFLCVLEKASRAHFADRFRSPAYLVVPLSSNTFLAWLGRIIAPLPGRTEFTYISFAHSSLEARAARIYVASCH